MAIHRPVLLKCLKQSWGETTASGLSSNAPCTKRLCQAQHCECTQCHWIVHFKMIRMVHFMLCLLDNFYKNIMSKYLPQVLAPPMGEQQGWAKVPCLPDAGVQERRPEGRQESGQAGPPQGDAKPSEVSASGLLGRGLSLPRHLRPA